MCEGKNLWREKYVGQNDKNNISAGAQGIKQ